MFRLVALTLILTAAQGTYGVPAGHSRLAKKALTEPDPSMSISVTLNGLTFVNKGLVAFGLIPSDFRESTGEIRSTERYAGWNWEPIALKNTSLINNEDGTFSGTIIAQPDRGFNVDGTVDYQGRQHEIDFVLSPYYGVSNLSFEEALSTLQLTYRNTLLYTERNGTKTSGLDALAVRPAQSGFPSIPSADPEMPIPSASFSHLSLDLEGLALNADGTFWVSDEYGPYIYLLDANGGLLVTVQPPDAILPETKKGTLDFTSEDDPKTGRAANQGFEGLTLDDSGETLYALLQSATIQDGGDDKSTSRFTRLLAYDVSQPSVTRPPLVGEFVVPLPQNSKGNTLAASELHFVSPGVFLVLSRDGGGHGGDDTSSSYKQADLIDIGDATDIHGTDFDQAKNPIANNGKLDKSITPATYVPFVSFINSTQLARFGLHNGNPADQTLIDAKWESLALASCGEPAFPHDYFLFTAADNDFITTEGISLGEPYNAGLDNDNQFLVFRITLPTK